MLGIEDYGSDSDSDQTVPTPAAPPKKSTFSLPPPPWATSTSKLSLPPPKPKRAPKKITIGLPSMPAPKDDEDDDLKDERPASKRPRLESGAGVSALLSMLPTPKQKNPVAPVPERVLGGGKGPGLVFNTSRPAQTNARPDNDEIDEDRAMAQETVPILREEPIEIPDSTESLPFLPPSLKKGRANISVEEGKPVPRAQTQTQPKLAPAVDFFSLGTAFASTSKVTLQATSSSTSIPSLSSAPAITTFEPPEPEPTDEYPGYYQLPSGTWAAHDPVYFAKFVKKWEAEYNAHVRALEKGMVKGFEGLESATVEEVNAMKVMEKAKLEIRDREERKAVTQGSDGPPAAPKMKITASKTSGIARSRHQLSTLLKEAYENREALEEKIAQGKRNRKEAGNKYGF
ncbi:hypothetical protein Hypma_011639 [Hypsizygus marmoreus]|uniref:Mitotic checkpoint regulator, MAD2B-interacting-domain-containing protein n=1 Tax=Hypsizygus marmoreus TaxID=39966 RepID=A0A369JID3_HYPMA|nr:hypothetical protein Hypma_011639 [Hypsizygus marmoreus]